MSKIIVLVCLLVLSSCGSRDSETRQADQAIAEPIIEEVVLYCSADLAIAEPIIEEFEKVSGIKVLARYDTEASKTVGLVQKIRAEADKPFCDVFWSSEVFHTIQMANEGLLVKYSGINPADWPKTYRDDGGMWFGFGVRSRVIAYNTDKISEADAPKTLEDLLKPEFKGRIAMARPVAGTTIGDVASWFVHYGDERGKEILQGLKDNKVLLVDGNSTAVRMIATSQADICLTDTDDVYAGQRNGWTIKMNMLDQGGDGALAIPNTAAMIKSGPNPEAAKILMDFLLSKRLEEMLIESDSHNSPLNKDLQQEHPEYSIVKPLEIEFEQVAKKMPDAIKAALEILD
ncbi:MAG: extracellular solute-binding protein [Phycisphaerae bacterium]|nr:extracellular solute-binding protein [Phycisphaerae bacterium]